MNSDQRRCPRTPLKCRIKITHVSIGEIEVNTRNISDGGVFIVTGDIEMPPVGTVVVGQVQGMPEPAPLLDMEIVRVEPEGVGLRFL
ncbi:PilZ domain-containing protein [Exilibacterium tricleocarpae]|uniref:PilZ domain-containing protein n=1 Tax=Exilibacterium tricleocarpae TaxID=2591008 RepID=A0A545TFS2_9GAMM|nr:PilZ domain-containing protein [Exilibacterium tricleocarpae]TQV76072.1 PilZ domain-containing protein [Exilibacterium tricleocarpae]